MKHTLLVFALLVGAWTSTATAQERLHSFDDSTGVLTARSVTKRTVWTATTVGQWTLGTGRQSDLLVDRTGRKAYLSRHDHVAVVDLLSGQITTWTSVASPGPLALMADGSGLFVGNRDGTSIVRR